VTAQSQGYIVSNPRWWNQDVESVQILHLFNCHIEGQAAPCEEKVVEVMLSAFPVFHSAT